MQQLRRFGGFFLLMLMLGLGGIPGRAQDVPAADSTERPPVPPRAPTPLPREVVRLKAALSASVGTAEAADSLLVRARRLAYLPGQVVALAQLAGIKLQQESPQADGLLKEAEALAGQLHDLKEAGWALNQVSRLQRRFGHLAPSAAGAYGPLLEALGDAMGRSVPAPKVIRILKDTEFNPLNAAAIARLEKQRVRSRLGLLTKSAALAMQEPMHGRDIRVELRRMDHWLDTLLVHEPTPPQVVRQLAARRKRRDSSQALSQAYAKEGDYARAYRYFLQYSAYKDSLTMEGTTRRLAALEYKQNLLKKEAQIQQLNRQRRVREQVARRQQQFVVALVACVALLAGVAFVLIRTNRARQLANHQLREQKETLQHTLTELKATQTQLIQSEKMASLGELTAGIAHEIQNPLNFVNNFSEVSNELVAELREYQQQQPRDPELEQELLADVQQNLKKISEHGSRASAIVRGMLEHARTSTGQKESVDLNALTEEYTQLAYHGARAKDQTFEARLTTNLDPRLGRVLAVPQEVSRVLLNVLSNAFYAVQKKQEGHPTGYKPEVSVSTKRTGQQVEIHVRDNGIGVPTSLKQKVFQPFFTTKPAGEGTGLGLSLSYDIITKGYGGTFTLESEEGQFTELTLTLPAVAA
ncbi:GHKL domain-containing protein [Microvirga sp. STS02]|uniref:sensor histidine kinase n=1 Tax=Hymenobacter negativus TaxID=2795026 RepID=UPI001B837566|nr:MULTISPECIES: ATP-binding protein [Bacteria]MBR7209429.1 GHKL domain-containing protein [Microvirga sp. STS02]